MKNKSTLLLEFSETNLKSCEVKFVKDKPLIISLKAEEISSALGPEDVEKISPILDKSKYDQIIISLPRSFFLMRFLELPAHDREELRKMLSFQLAKIILCPLDEILYDFSLIETKDGHSKVIVFIVQKKKIKHLMEFINKKGIAPSVITLSSCGMNNWLKVQEKFSKSDMRYPIVLIDVDKESADFVVLNSEGNDFL